MKAPRAPRRGFLDTVLLLPLLYALYAMTPLGAIGETAVRVARGQADRPDWLSTFRGRETDVAYAATPTPVTPLAGPMPGPLHRALLGQDPEVVIAVEALFATHGSCSDTSCTLATPAAAAELWPAVQGRSVVSAEGAVTLVRRAAQAWGAHGLRTPELVIETVSIGVEETRRAVAQAERSGAEDPDDVEVHAPFLPPSVRRGPLQAALVTIAHARLQSLSWPADDRFAVTSPFGDRLHPVLGEYKFHNGTDIGVPVGTALRAAYRGRVARSSEDSVSGRYVVLNYGLGLESVLCHLSEAKVRARDRVDRDEQVALSGATGRITGPHLHYILRVQGKPVDPESYRFDDRRARPR